MENIELINFIDLTLDEQKTVLDWRNNPLIQKYMFDSKNIPLVDHLAFIDSLKIIQKNQHFKVSNLGVINLKKIDIQNNSAEIGLYSNPDKFGVGKILMEKILQFPYKKLYLEVFSNNEKAIKLYQRFNFKETHREKIENRELIYMELNR
ncbi:pseudaminic acid biosynthesis N-acetyl transferase [Thiovulum sp. ES]|nr:pseudaminic acid biosynthesis N-acetyl transferase [Thiovulum sp. ES]